MNIEYLRRLRLHELKVIEPILEHAQSKQSTPLRILEIGAGTGHQTVELRSKGFDVSPIDLESSNYTANQVIEVITYDGFTIPFDDGKFDVVFSSNVLEHIPHIDAFHNEMQRVLRKNGLSIHILPSATWRIWTSVLHFPNLFLHLCRVFLAKVMSVSKSDVTVRNQTSKATLSNKTKPTLTQRIIACLSIPRHGEKGNHITEIYFFSRFYWSKNFKEHGWILKHYDSNHLFYTGHGFLERFFSIPLRKIMSRILGSSCHVFLMLKNK